MRTGTTRLFEFVLLVVLAPAVVVAQDVALVAAVKGTVSIKSASGRLTPASVKTKLMPGDEVSTKSDGSATVLYYTGKEVSLGANKNHVVAKGEGEDSFLKRLGRVFSNFLWSSGSSRSMLGATRRVGQETTKPIRGIYPCMSTSPGKALRFEWVELRPTSERKYEVIVRNPDGNIVKRTAVQDTTVAVIAFSDGDLTPGVEYRWEVQGLTTAKSSGEIKFKFLSDDEIGRLDKSLKKIDSECSHDSSAFRGVLLRSLLYIDFNLMREAESSLTRLVQLKRDLAIGHEMLAEVYAKVGKLDEALTEQRIATSLTEIE